MVSISKKWKTQKNNDEKLSFQVNKIEETFKPELSPSVFGAGSMSTAVSSLGAGSSSQVPPLGPLMWSTSPAPHAHGSSAKQTPPAASRLDPSTPARSSAPKRVPRRSLFNTPSKKKPEPNEATTEEHDLNSATGAVLKDVAVVAEDTDDPSLSQKNKATAEDKDENPKTKKGRKNK